MLAVAAHGRMGTAGKYAQDKEKIVAMQGYIKNYIYS